MSTRAASAAVRPGRRGAATLVASVAAIWAAGWLGACGAAQPAPVTRNVAAPADSRTPIEQRRDAACDRLGPRLTLCAVADAERDFGAGKIDRAQLDRDTAPAIQRKNTEEFEKACKRHAYSSRQVRVLEVCFHDEPQCAPLLDCLGHLSDRPPGAP